MLLLLLLGALFYYIGQVMVGTSQKVEYDTRLGLPAGGFIRGQDVRYLCHCKEREGL